MRIPHWTVALCCLVFVTSAALPAAWAAAPVGLGAFSDAASVTVGGAAPVAVSVAVPVAVAAPVVETAAAPAAAPATPAPGAPAPAALATSKRVPLPWYATGTVDMTFQVSDIKGSPALANEYGMNDTGPRATVIVDMGNGEYVGSFEASGVLDMQPRTRNQGFLGDSYDVKASVNRVKYYKLSAYRTIINHNISDGKTTMTSAVGSTTILPSTSVTDAVTHFTFNRRRINTGVEGEFSWDTPFFVNVRYDQQKVDGILPKYYFSSNNGVFGTPVNFQVDVVSVQAGIRTKAVTALVDASLSNLSDSVNWLYGRSGTGFGGFPPSDYTYNYSKRPITPSSMGKYGASLAWRMPEWATTLQMRFSQSHLSTGDYDTHNKYGSSMYSKEQVYTDSYSGSIVNTYAAASLSTSPFKGFTSRVYVNYHNRDNQNSLDWQSGRDKVDDRQSDYNKLYNGFYSFSRITSGLELSYRITPDYKVSSGYEFYQMDRSRYTFGYVPYTIDNKVWGQVDSELTDWLAARLKYQFLDRNSAKNRYVAEGPVNDNQAYVDYMSPADSASKNQHMLKLSFDLSLFKDMGLTLEYALKQDNYTQKQPLGMDTALRHDFHADANYRIGPVTLGAYGGVEFSKYNANYRAYTNAATANPSLSPTDKAYNWDMKQQDTAYVFGASVEWDIKPKSLKLKLAYDAERADGRTDIGTQIPVNAVESINPVDRYQRDSLETRLTWTMTDTQSLGLGYRYEHLNYMDWAYEGLSATATAQSYYGVQRSFDIHTAFMTYQYTF